MLCSSVLLGELRTVLFAHIYPVCGSKVSRGCGMILITAGSVELRDLSACCYWMKEWKCRRDEIFAFPRFENVMILGSRYEEISTFTRNTRLCVPVFWNHFVGDGQTHTHTDSQCAQIHIAEICSLITSVCLLSQIIALLVMYVRVSVCVCGWMS